MHIKKKCQAYRNLTIIMVFQVFAVLQAVAGVDRQPLKWEHNGIRIVLEDYLNIPAMSWPQTLLEYPVDFSSEPISEDEIQLIDVNSNEIIPFQLTDIVRENGKVKSALLCLISDLPSGVKKEFRLENKTASKIVRKQKTENSIHIQRKDQLLQVDNGLLKIGFTPTETPSVAMPLLKVGNSDHWLGTLALPEQLVPLQVIVEELSKGSLMAEYALNCTFTGNKSYQLKIRVISGMEFLEMEENMQGFSVEDSLSLNLKWHDFHPEYRYCPNRNDLPIDKQKKGYNNFVWEKITGSPGDPLATNHPNMPYDRQNLPDGQIPFKLTIYHNWMTWWRLHLASFWNETTGQSVGIFIKEFEKWVDPAYPIWGSKDNLAVKFFYKDEAFRWDFPLVTGKRSVALVVYPHKKDIETSDRTNYPKIYVDVLRRWYGWISLNKTKDWILDYEVSQPNHPAFFKSDKQRGKFNPKELLQNLKRQVQEMSEASERGRGPTPVGTRSWFDHITPLFEYGESILTAEEYHQARALYLFMNNVFMDEALMPMINMLSGHPNFLADIKGVPGMAAFLFPDHPQAQAMADHFEKATALNLRYHTRPTEPAWDAKGGRWTENLGCYTWAFLRPTLRTSFLLHHFYDGKNRMLQPNIDIYADWLLNGLTSPLDIEDGKRVNPPQGAHSQGHAPSLLLHTLGQELRYYEPLLSEYLLWVTTPDDGSIEAHPDRPDVWDGPIREVFKQTSGTNPHLVSAKYTGYGFNLRSHFNEPDEIYVHLQQIDAGPNYRWGRAGRGGNGVIYYYAEGKRYSHNGSEDVGDAPFGDTERCTNFGVKKGKFYRSFGDYRSVGINDLTEPLYDFGFAQFASVLANEEAAPEYRSRSILMSGNDYILILDDVRDNTVEGRLSWFVGKDDDYPYIHQLTPGINYVDTNIQPTNSPYHKDPEVLPTKGRYYDGKGDFLTLVTHKEAIQPVADAGAYRINKPDGSSEWVFRNDKKIVFDRKQMLFEGQAGLIRQSKEVYEAALFQGEKVGIPGLTAEWLASPQSGGISLRKDASGFSGIIQVQEKAAIRFTADEKVTKSLVFYLDGTASALTSSGKNTYQITIPAGKHRWQWTNNGVIPEAPVIVRSSLGASKCDFGWTPVAGATSYKVQKSADGGKTWSAVAENITETHYRLSGLSAGAKIHVRVIAKGQGGDSEPSTDYPVYASNDKPDAPEGLRAEFTNGKVDLSWGQILGSDKYKLYHRKKGTTAFNEVYSGEQRNTTVRIPDGDIYEFAVTAINDNGESGKSYIIDTDPDRLINWYPIPGEIFRRDTESHENGYIEYNHWLDQQMPILKYPFQMK